MPGNDQPSNTDRSDAPARVGPVAHAAIGVLKVYRVTLSPALTALGVRCRHLPTCSEYSIAAFRRHGAWIGFWLTLSRVSRCHPFGSHGFDPPPDDRPPVGWRAWRHGDWSWRERS
ncbi:MAG: membrane protein insertion efficiency factor YidD [Pseudomonadota bacterium]